jgi:hypothetical protein
VQPERFTRAFGVQRQDSGAWAFFCLVLGAQLLFGLVGILVTFPAWDCVDPKEWFSFTVFVGAYLTLATCGVSFTDGIVLWLSCTHYDGKRHLRPWLAIVAYASAHYLIILLLLPLVPIALLLRNTFDPPLFMFGMTLILHIGGGCLSGFTLNGVVKLRTARDRRTIFAPLALLLAHVIVPIISLAVGGFCVALLKGS